MSRDFSCVDLWPPPMHSAEVRIIEWQWLSKDTPCSHINHCVKFSCSTDRMLEGFFFLIFLPSFGLPVLRFPPSPQIFSLFCSLCFCSHVVGETQVLRNVQAKVGECFKNLCFKWWGKKTTTNNKLGWKFHNVREKKLMQQSVISATLQNGWNTWTE